MINGSQRSYVLTTLMKDVEIATIRTKYIAVGTSEASTTKCLPRDAVNITVMDRTDQENIYIEPIIENKKCNPKNYKEGRDAGRE